MARFGEEIRCILADVAKFLCVTLKRVTIPADASSQRLALMKKLDELQQSYPQLHWELEDDDSCGRDSTEPASRSNAVVNDQKPALLAACDISDPAKCGFLNKKTHGRLIKAKKVWCVVKDGIFYGYEKPTSKTQSFSFPLKVYEVKTTKSENVLELIPRNETDLPYTFSFGDYGELQSWAAVLSTRVHTTADEKKPSPVYEDMPLSQSGPSVAHSSGKRSSLSHPTSADKSDAPTTDLYEEMGNFQAAEKKGSGAATESNSTSSSVVPGGHVAADRLDSDMYSEIPLSHQPEQDGIASSSSPAAAGPKPSKLPLDNGQKTVTSPPPSQLSTVAERKVEVKNVGESALGRRSSNSADEGQSGPAVVATRTPGRQEVPPNKRQSMPGLDLPSSADVEVYVAEWDCVADAANELTFKKGEQLLIVSRQYEHLGWLVAQRTGGCGSRRTGLVPKDYVTKAK